MYYIYILDVSMVYTALYSAYILLYTVYMYINYITCTSNCHLWPLFFIKNTSERCGAAGRGYLECHLLGTNVVLITLMLLCTMGMPKSLLDILIVQFFVDAIDAIQSLVFF